MNIKPLPTQYDGYRFRSRLEARWYIAIKMMGMHPSYEYEGFDLGGIAYLPDFYIPRVGLGPVITKLFIEIKPEPEDDLTKYIRLSKSTPVIILNSSDVCSFGASWQYCYQGKSSRYLRLIKCHKCKLVNFLPEMYSHCPGCHQFIATVPNSEVHNAIKYARGYRFK